MAKIIKSDGTVMEVEPRNGKNFELQEMQSVVGGHIEVLWLGDNLMIVNEEGKLNNLPINVKATRLLRGTIYQPDIVVGDVLYCLKEQVK